MAIAPKFRINTNVKACTGLVCTSANSPNKWVWTAKLVYDSEVQDAWKCDGEFDTAGHAVSNCYAFLRSMDFSPGPVEEL